LIRLLDAPDVGAAAFSDAFLAPPLYSNAHAEGVGTVYTAAYVPEASSVTYRWPGHDWTLQMDDLRRRGVHPCVPRARRAIARLRMFAGTAGLGRS
jgi:hypothetical protein